MSERPVVLVVDDKPNMVSLLAKVLEPVSRVVTAGTVREALVKIDEARVATVLCDLRMPDGDGLDVLRALRAKGSRAPFILMTAYATVGTAVQAMREGAYDYITKPFDTDVVRSLVERALATSAVLSAGPEADADASAPERLGALLGRSASMKGVFRLIERIARTNATVLLLGETGTGKELAVDGGGGSDAGESMDGMAMGKPGTPQIAAVAKMGGALHVSWKLNDTGLTSVELWRKKATGDYAVAYTLPGSATSQHDMQATDSAQYCYKVMTHRDSDMSDMSNEMCGTP